MFVLRFSALPTDTVDHAVFEQSIKLFPRLLCKTLTCQCIKLRCLQTSSSWKLLRFLWACSSLKNNRTSQFCYATVLLSETVFYIISVRSCNAAVTSLKTRLNRCRHWTSTKTKAVCIRINAVRWYKMTARLKGRRDRRNFCVKAAVTKH